MATTLGGTTLPIPAACDEYEPNAGYVQFRMADGSMITSTSTIKRGWRLRWPDAISTADKDTIRGKYVVTASQSFSPPDEAGSYTTVVIRGSWSREMLKKSGYYVVGFDLEQV